jgi:uncharacterized repeat protein (TIGR03847 family)
MPRRRFVFDPPDRFVAGTVGEPGQRTFFLQARAGRRIVSVSLEKAQVVVLADRLIALLDELQRRGMVESEPAQPGAPADVDPGLLEEPLNEAFRAGTLTLGWDGDDELIVVEAREGGDEDAPLEASDEPADAEDDEDGPDVVRIRMSASGARSFAEGATRVVAAGRPPCPLCGEPLDPLGHLCPRRNGTFLN